MNKKLKIIIPVFISLAVFYLITASKSLSQEIQFLPVWTIDLESYIKDDSNPLSQEDFSNIVPFKMGQNLGWFNTDGKILNYITFPYKASISENSYSLYGTSSDEIIINDASNNEIAKITEKGFPYFAENRKFIFLPGGNSFAKLNDDGSAAWKYEGFTPITAFSSSATGTAAGFANGSVIVFDSEGNISQQYNPGGSNYEVILGIAVSDSSKYIATLSGQDSQRFVISKKTDESYGSHTSIIFFKTMENEVNRQVLIKFSRDEKKVFYNSASGIGIVNCRTFKNTEIPLKGRILSIQETESGNEIIVLSKNENIYTISTIESFDVLTGSFSFDADNAFIATKGNSLFVGRDGRISKIDIIHK
ncbi:hypothetical protein [Treponema sp.]|uniref:hypothetical protein n=1 Tax=Treponema sp. TaxID=166 RepID=UPI0038910CE5